MLNLTDLLAEYLVYARDQLNYSIHTVKAYRSALSRYVTWAESSDAEPFTLESLRLFQTAYQRTNPLRPSSVARDQCAFRAFGAWLVETGALPVNPALSLRKVKMDEPIVRGASEEEACALIEASSRLKDPRRCILAKAVICTLLFTGIRRSELTGLDVSDIDLSGKRLLVRFGKGGKSRSIPMNADLVAALSEWLAARKAPDCVPALFCTKPSSGLTEFSLRSLLNDVRIAAGMRERIYLRPHAFRRYFATYLQRHGAGLATISKLMGHASVSITCSYLQSTEAEKEAAVDLFCKKTAPVSPLRLVATEKAKRRPAGPRVSIRLRAS